MLYRPRERVDAVRWSGSNWHEVLAFCGHGKVSTDGKDIFVHGKSISQPVPTGAWLFKKGEFDHIWWLSDERFNEDYEPDQ